MKIIKHLRDNKELCLLKFQSINDEIFELP